MKLRVILILAFLLTGLLLPAQKQTIKDNTTYYLTSIYIGGKKNVMVKDKGHIVFDLKQKTASCFTSCNFIKLKFTMKDNALKFTSIVPAKEPCPDPLIGIEEDIKENLPKVTAFTVSGKQLALQKGKETLIIFTEANVQSPAKK